MQASRSRRAVLPSAAFVVALFAGSTAAHAERLLNGDELRRLVTGRTIFLATPLGGELPINYRANGTVDGDGQAVGLGRFFQPRDRGRWFIAGNRLCQQWETWYDGQRLCFTITDLGNGRLRWVRDNGEQGLARLGP